MALMIYFHWFLQTPMHPERQVPIFVKALSMDNLILFVLSTPVQVLIFFKHFCKIFYNLSLLFEQNFEI